MKIPQKSDLGVSLEHSRSGLRDSHRRSLLSLLFLVTGSALLVFGTLQLINGHIWLGTFEYLVSGLLLWSRQGLRNTRHLHRWVYGFLVSFCFFSLLIILVPEASITAFVWILMIPVLSYLLLGKSEGLRLSLPSLIAGCVIFAVYQGRIDSTFAIIDLLNMVLCATLMLFFIHIYETRREEAEKRLFDMAQMDSLTGLANRACFNSVLNRTMAECNRNGSGFALVIMDIDHFKRVNDTMGHDAGDQVLGRIGSLLTERLRATDSVGRLGGEEFGLILRDLSPDAAYALIEELRERIASDEISYGEARIQLTASFGIAHYPDHAKSSEALYRLADRCLFAGKRAGRNTVSQAGVAMLG